MEIITISDSKIKIILSADDLSGYELDTASLDYSNTETKRMFWDILSRAKRATGFDTDGHRVLVQLYPSRCGGCEMFVTRLSCHKNEGEEKPRIEPVINRLPPKRSTKDDDAELRTGAFAFESIGALISVCKRLLDVGYNGESDAYLGDDSRSYLFLSDMETCPYLTVNEYSFISEYGTEENEEAALSYVGEHARRICSRHAVEKLSRF